jgi:hypothetical protein
MEKNNMTTKNKMQNKKKNGKIVDVNCYVNLSENGCFINYEEETYITSRKLLEKLIEGTLKTQKKKKAKSIKLGFKDDGEIQDADVFLTIKGRCVYFVPYENEVLLAPLQHFKKLVNGEYSFVKMGKLED